MGLNDWNWKLPAEIQDVPWDCAAASLTWALNAIGRDVTEAGVVKGLGPTRISPEYGLLDASGAGIVDYLAEIGISALNDSASSWEEVCAAAGYQPMIIGGRNWYHWTGVRIWAGLVDPNLMDWVALANPAPGWMGVGQELERASFDALGPFAAVWFTSW